LKLNRLILKQRRLSKKVKVEKIKKEVRWIAGVDVALNQRFLFGCMGIFSFPALSLVDYSCARAENKMPYIPGFLSFREVPVILKCYKKIKKKPDLILVDGQGIAHPRALGLASHLGIILKTPTIGCAKSHLFGDYAAPSSAKGSYCYIKDGAKKIGLVLRTRDNTKTLFVSPGHLVNIEDCRKYVFSTLTKYRIPEPLRFAHMKAGEKARRSDV
jgi:deoxyribonuclease V